jgi:hypothetical protein
MMQLCLRLGLNHTLTWGFAAILLAVLLPPTKTWPQPSTSLNEAKAASTAASIRPLDGRQFNVHIVQADATKDGENRGLGDRLVFSGGKFSSAICKKFNFAEAPYWVRMEGDHVYFLAELTSPTDGKMRWEGIVRGDELTGTMRWTKARWYWNIDAKHKILGKLVNGLTAASPTSN